jgi:cold shock CspA family protein
MACVVVVVPAGCGGGDDPERSGAEAVARDYVDAFVKGDGERACALMTDEVRGSFEARTDTAGCAPAFARASELLGDEQRRLLEGAEVEIDVVQGDVATGTIRVEGDLSTPVEVRRVAGRWLYATPPRDP